MIVGQLLQLAVAKLVEPAVADVPEMDLAPEKESADQGCSHVLEERRPSLRRSAARDLPVQRQDRGFEKPSGIRVAREISHHGR